MEVAPLLDRLRCAGLHLTSDGERVLVTPSHLLTDELRDDIHEHRGELIAALSLHARLIGAINDACDARGDDDANRRALIAECSRLLPEQQLDMLGHFTGQAAMFRAARRGGEHV